MQETTRGRTREGCGQVQSRRIYREGKGRQGEKSMRRGSDKRKKRKEEEIGSGGRSRMG